MRITSLGVQKKPTKELKGSSKILDDLFNKPKIEVKPKDKPDMRSLGQKLNDPEWRKKHSTPTAEEDKGAARENPPSTAKRSTSAPSYKVKINGETKTITSEDGKPFTWKEVQELQLDYLKQTNPEAHKQHEELKAQEDALPSNDPKKGEIAIQRANLVAKGKADKPEPTQYDNSFRTRFSNALDRIGDAADETINRPGERIQKAGKGTAVEGVTNAVGAVANSQWVAPSKIVKKVGEEWSKDINFRASLLDSAPKDLTERNQDAFNKEHGVVDPNPTLGSAYKSVAGFLDPTQAIKPFADPKSWNDELTQQAIDYINQHPGDKDFISRIKDPITAERVMGGLKLAEPMMTAVGALMGIEALPGQIAGVKKFLTSPLKGAKVATRSAGEIYNASKIMDGVGDLSPLNKPEFQLPSNQPSKKGFGEGFDPGFGADYNPHDDPFSGALPDGLKWNGNDIEWHLSPTLPHPLNPHLNPNSPIKKPVKPSVQSPLNAPGDPIVPGAYDPTSRFNDAQIEFLKNQGIDPRTYDTHASPFDDLPDGVKQVGNNLEWHGDPTLDAPFNPYLYPNDLVKKRGTYQSNLTKNPPTHPKPPQIEAQGQVGTGVVNDLPIADNPIIAGARKSVQAELRPGGEIAAEALQHYTGPKEAVTKGKELFDSGADMHTLANNLATTPRAIKPEETTALLHHIGKLVDQRAGLKAMESSMLPEDYLANFDHINNNIQTAYDAIRKGGREASASLNSLRTVLRKDMSMDTGAELIKKVSGKEATSEQMKALQELQVKHDDLSSQLDHVNTRLDEASKEIANLKAGKGSASATTRKTQGKAKFETGKQEFADLWKQLNSTEDGVTRLGSGVHLTTKELVALSKPAYQMVRGLVDVGIGTAEQIFATAAMHMSELTGRTVTADHVSEMYDLASGQTKNRMKALTDINNDIAYVQKSGGLPTQKRVNLLSKQAKELENEIKLARSERNKLIRDASAPGVAEKANGFLNTLQLTDPIARGIDFVANGSKLAAYALETPVRKSALAGVNKATGSALISPGAGSPLTKVGRNRMQRVFEGYGTSTKERFGSEATHGKYGISTSGGFSNAGYKFAGYSDAPAKELYYRMHLDSQAESLARAELGAKASPEAINARTKYHTSNASNTMKQAAEDFADLQTFNSKSAVQGLSKAISDAGLEHGGKLGQTVGRQSTRFWNVMANVAQDRIERTGYGAAVGAANEARKLATAFKGAGIVDPVAAHKLANLVAKGATGAALYHAGAYFQKTYGGFAEIKRNPKGGTAWIDNGVWEQFGGILSQFTAGATDAEIELNGGNEKDSLRFKANVSMLFSQPMFSQQQNLLNLVGNSDPDKAVKTAGSVFGSYFVPSIIRRGSKIFDTNDPDTSVVDKVMQGRPLDTKPEKVDGKTDKRQMFINEAFRKNIPGLRNQLPTKKIVKNGKAAEPSPPRKFQSP